MNHLNIPVVRFEEKTLYENIVTVTSCTGCVSRYTRDFGPAMGWVQPELGSANKTKQEAPYSYSPFYHFRDTSGAESESACSDRLRQWDCEKWNEARRMLSPGPLEYQSRLLPDAMMSFYLGKPVKVVSLAEGCNVSNDYPYYIFRWRDAQSKPGVEEEVCCKAERAFRRFFAVDGTGISRSFPEPGIVRITHNGSGSHADYDISGNRIRRVMSVVNNIQADGYIEQ